MKVRQGFVTNSSSTSFCIVGTHIEGLREAIENDPERLNKLLKVYNEKTGRTDDAESFLDDISYNLEEVFPDLAVTHGPSYEGGLYVGFAIDSMKDEETMGDFKQRALKAIQAIDASVTAVGIMTEGWYDG